MKAYEELYEAGPNASNVKALEALALPPWQEGVLPTAVEVQVLFLGYVSLFIICVISKFVRVCLDNPAHDCNPIDLLERSSEACCLYQILLP